MSYDLEILAKIESGDYICIDEPRYSSPTYNLGKIFRIAMDWDFDQGTIYNVADIFENIQRGITELVSEKTLITHDSVREICLQRFATFLLNFYRMKISHIDKLLQLPRACRTIKYRYILTAILLHFLS